MQTTKFSPRISEAKTVDEILSAHQTFLDTLIQESMLGRQELFLMLYKIFSVCEVFVAYVSQKTAPIFSAAEDYRTQKNQILRKLSLTVKNPLQRQIQARQVLLQVRLFCLSNFLLHFFFLLISILISNSLFGLGSK